VRRAESRARALAAEVRRLRPPARLRAANRELADAIAAQAGELRALGASGRSPLVLRNEMGDTPALRRVRTILDQIGGVLKPSPSASLVPIWMRTLGLPRAARPGAVLFADVGCLACHTYAGTGSSNLGGPDLTAEAGRGRGTAWQTAHLRCPSCVVRGSPMPAFASLGAARVHELAVFLEASRGRR
jgi:hypothetical protein